MYKRQVEDGAGEESFVYTGATGTVAGLQLQDGEGEVSSFSFKSTERF